MRLSACAVILGLISLTTCALADPITYTTIDDPNAPDHTLAYGINGSGQIVGYYSTNSGIYGFEDTNGAFTTVTDPNATNGTFAYGINGAGQIVGSYDDNSGYHGFIDTNGVFTTLNDPGAVATYAYGINDSGQIVGAYEDAYNRFHGFLYSNGTFTNFDEPNDIGSTYAYGINDSGQIVGYYYDNAGLRGFVDTNGIFTTISGPNASNAFAYGINGSGQIVGADFYPSAAGFVDTNGNLTSISDPNATTGSSAQGINDGGEVVGYYSDSAGYHGFLATTSAVPEPGTLGSISLMAVLLLPFAWRRRLRPRQN